MKNAEKPEYTRFILQTPNGYLTPTCTTWDICDKSIIILTSATLGPILSSKEEKVKKFFERSNLDYIPFEKCELLGYACHAGPHSCNICGKSDHCKFEKNRANCILFKTN